MKALLVLESREGKLLASSLELLTYAEQAGLEFDSFLVGSKADLPQTGGKLFLADSATHGDYNPATHKALVLQAAQQASAERIVFSHSFYGWDLAPRVALAWGAGQVSDVSSAQKLEAGCYNAKLRRSMNVSSPKSVVTVQVGAFPPAEAKGAPEVTELSAEGKGSITVKGYTAPEASGPDLGKAEVVVGVGRGVGKPENLPALEALAAALKGEIGCSRPVADLGWVDSSRQVGTTGQTVTPKLYVACGISGAIQHLAGMKNSEFIVAINKDKDAPIAEAADVFVVADLQAFAPVLTEKLKG